jgi:hypothetical protein
MSDFRVDPTAPISVSRLNDPSHRCTHEPQSPIRNHSASTEPLAIDSARRTRFRPRIGQKPTRTAPSATIAYPNRTIGNSRVSCRREQPHQPSEANPFLLQRPSKCSQKEPQPNPMSVALPAPPTRRKVPEYARNSREHVKLHIGGPSRRVGGPSRRGPLMICAVSRGGAGRSVAERANGSLRNQYQRLAGRLTFRCRSLSL